MEPFRAWVSAAAGALLLLSACDSSSPSSPSGNIGASSFRLVSVSVPVGGTTPVGTAVQIRVEVTTTQAGTLLAQLEKATGAVFASSNTQADLAVGGPFQVTLSSTPREPGEVVRIAFLTARGTETVAEVDYSFTVQ